MSSPKSTIIEGYYRQAIESGDNAFVIPLDLHINESDVYAWLFERHIKIFDLNAYGDRLRVDL